MFHKLIELLRFGADYITIKQSLLRIVILNQLILAIVLISILSIEAENEVDDLTSHLTHVISDGAVREIQRFIEPVKRHLTMAQRWTETQDEAFQSETTQGYFDIFAPVVDVLPQMSSVHSVRQQTETMLLQNGTDWILRITGGAIPAHTGRFVTWRNNQIIRDTILPSDYITQDRPWYKNAIAKRGQIQWSAPYRFFTTGEPGITASISNEDGSHVTAIDILLSDIVDFSEKMTVADSGFVFIFNEYGTLISLSRNHFTPTSKDIHEHILKPIDSTGIQLFKMVHDKWKSASSGFPVQRFHAVDDDYRVQIKSVPLSDNTSIFLGVAIPESVIRIRIDNRRLIVTGLIFFSMFVAMFVTLYIAKSFSQPLEAITAESEKITAIQLDSDHIVNSRIYEIARLSEAQVQLRAAMNSFSRYVPVDLVRELTRSGDVAKIGGKNAELVMMFTDIEAFSTKSEKMDPQVLADHMADYFDEMLSVLADEHATVDKFIGDAIMAFWGAPNPDPEQINRGLRAAWRCAQRLEQKNPEWEAAGLPNMRTRFGLDCGPVIVGNVGANHRLSYTVLGDRVNRASRLEGLNKFYGTTILVSEDIVRQSSGFVFRIIDKVAVKGKHEPLTVYELLGIAGQVESDRMEIDRIYTQAFLHYQSRLFDKAIQELVPIVDRDAASKRLHQICVELQKQPPSADWNGVFQHESK